MSISSKISATPSGPALSSRISGFHRLPLSERFQRLRDRLRDRAPLTDSSWRWLADGGGLSIDAADCISENVIAVHGLPFSIALNFRVNQRDVLVPMAIEEPSVVAAACNAARLVRASGGFVGDFDAPIMTAQVQLDDVDLSEAKARDIIEGARRQLLAIADAAIPRMVTRGGGAVDIDVRVLDVACGTVVVQLYVNVGDAMGANLVDTVAEAVAPRIHQLLGGQMGLRILSNLPLRRRARVSAEVRVHEKAGFCSPSLAAGIERASRFAECDPLRAATHNKGIMNGIDAVAVALGQDWRAIEASAHAYAAIKSPSGYGPLATWQHDGECLRGSIEMPIAVGTVGGATRVHRGVQAALEIVNVASAGELALVMLAAGLASNLAALRALAGEGIQRGHMRLHQRRHLAAPATAAAEPSTDATARPRKRS